MQELVERIGIQQFIQVVVEIWSEMFMMIMIFSLSMKMKFADKDKVYHFDITYTKDIVIFYNAILLYNFFNILGIIADGSATKAGSLVAGISDFLYYLSGGFLTFFLIQLIKKHIAVRNGMEGLRKAAVFMQVLHAGLLVLLVITPFTGLLYSFDEKNFYLRGPCFFIWSAVTIASFLFIIFVYITKRCKTDIFLRRIICVSVIIPLFGVFLNIVTNAWISFNNIAATIAAFIIFMFYEKNRTYAAVQRYRELERAKTELAEKMLALEQSKNVILLAQIQPHFINNYLMSLRSRCRDDAELYDYVTNFSRYMRAHFSAPGDSKMISFEQEMESVEAYLALESENFGDRLNVEYDIEYDSFLVPSFSVQPLVENAVRHGIATFDGGGTVYIRVHRQDSGTVIDIIDVGIGKSNITKRQSERKRIGYDNVRARLMSASAGHFDIISDEHGTDARIILAEKKTEIG